MQIDVHILHVPTGERAVDRSQLDVADTPEELELLEFMWSEGNYSCDGNRAQFFARATGRAEMPNRGCDGDDFLVEKIVERNGDRILYADDASDHPAE